MPISVDIIWEIIYNLYKKTKIEVRFQIVSPELSESREREMRWKCRGEGEPIISCRM